VIKVFTGLLSAVLGILPFWLAAWGANSSFDVWPFQVGSAVGAVVLGLWTYLTSRKRYPGRTVAIGVGGFGAFVGALWLMMVGTLWLVWPK
jgi:heme/copper-type cytochrome/quinol oxidase subunit 4